MRSTKKTGCRPRCAFLGERNRCKNYNCSTQQLYCLKTGIEVETHRQRSSEEMLVFSISRLCLIQQFNGICCIRRTTKKTFS